MKSRVFLFVIAILAVIALSMLTTTAYLRWVGPEKERFPRRPTHPSEFLRKELGLSDAQIAQIEAQRSSFEEHADSLRAELHEKRVALMEELRAEVPDTVRIDQLVDEIAVFQAGLEKQVIRHMLREQSLLTPEQRQKFFSMFHRHFREREEMPWQGPGQRKGLREGRESRSFQRKSPQTR